MRLSNVNTRTATQYFLLDFAPFVLSTEYRGPEVRLGADIIRHRFTVLLTLLLYERGRSSYRLTTGMSL